MIYFVGAGSGATDLITIRGDKLIREADTIIYAGSLVNPDLLKVAKEHTKIYNSATLTLEEVISIMIEAEKNNELTVRLHTGDPCLYGAIKEQMTELDKNNISYEVCPGVSSFCGAAAALNTEYTLPGVSQTVIITRMEGRTLVPTKEDITLLAAHQATMVIFLSTTLLKDLTKRLISGGYSEDTSAAIVYKATWPDEQIIHCSVKDLEFAAKSNNINKMALIIVGNCLNDDFLRSKLYDPSFTTNFRQGVDS